MDLMKVIDQAVREIKREVNIKVLKVPEIEQKVLDATSDEPWGPHGSALAEIAQATKKFTECQMIMNVLWTRLTETDRNWRYVYKALAVIEYLVANGSERAVDDILEHTFQISSLSGFEFVEPSGKDVGINVRKKVETLMALLHDKDKIQQTREKAAANRDKYLGVSSTGITYKPSSASYGSGNFQQTGLSSARESEMFKTSYRERARYGEETDRDQGKGYAFSKDYHGKSRSQRDTGNGNKGNDSKKGPAHDNRDQDDNYGPIASSQSSNAQPISNDDDFDDFDPRGSSTAGSGAAGINKVDLFGESLIIDLIDAPASVPTERTSLNGNASSDVDLFADATFVSASPHTETQGRSFSNDSTKVDLFADAAFASALPHAETQGSSHTQASVDLFANPSFPAGSSSMVDFFTEPSPILPTVTESSKSEPTKPNTIDPFASVPLSKFEESDLFGAFTSHTDSPATSTTEGLNNPIHKTVAESKPPPKKDMFQVKSGIWADSLSRGLIDLNITAPKKTSLADVGIVGLDDGSDEKARGLLASGYMGRTMGVGSGLGWSGFNSSTTGSDGSFSNFNQNQFGNFK